MTAATVYMDIKSTAEWTWATTWVQLHTSHQLVNTATNDGHVLLAVVCLL